MRSDEHWLSKLRAFIDNAVEEVAEYRDHLKEHKLTLKEFNPLETIPPSAWVDGGSGVLNLVGGSAYVIKAAAGVFKSGEPTIWQSDMQVGFTTLARNVDRYVGIQRDILEVEILLEVIHRGAEFAVLDNSLANYATMGVPHSILRFFIDDTPEERPEYEYFEAFVKFKRRFDTLIRECQIQNVRLIGAAKDPRSRSYVSEMGLPAKFNDSSTISMLAGGQIGFTKPLKSRYLIEERVRKYLEDKSILTDGRSDFFTVFGILKANARVFRLDYLEGQRQDVSKILQFITSMHDGNGYLIPSHVVHNQASVPQVLMKKLTRLMLSQIAKKDMRAAGDVFGAQRRSRF